MSRCESKPHRAKPSLCNFAPVTLQALLQRVWRLGPRLPVVAPPACSQRARCSAIVRPLSPLQQVPSRLQQVLVPPPASSRPPSSKFAMTQLLQRRCAIASQALLFFSLRRPICELRCLGPGLAVAWPTPTSPITSCLRPPAPPVPPAHCAVHELGPHRFIWLGLQGRALRSGVCALRSSGLPERCARLPCFIPTIQDACAMPI